MEQAGPAAPSRTTGPLLLRAAVVLVLVLAVLLRLGSTSALWLDEAISVSIAALPLAQLPDALRVDGAPPLYYLLLHGWTALLGTSDVAVRLLSGVLSLAALPLAWQAGARLGGPAAGWTALLLLASNPFAVRYASETRMYSLLVLLVLLGVLVLHGALRDPRPWRLVALAALSGALALTHYWALFLLAVVGAGLLALAWRGPRARRRPARRALLGVAAGGLLFLPWLPVFLFQLARTGAPWARRPGLDAVLSTWDGWGGRGLAGEVLGLLLLGLAVTAVVGRPVLQDGRQGLVLRLPASPPALALLGTTVLTLVLGVAVAVVGSSGFALRYTAVALPPALLAATLGARALPPRLRAGVVPLAVVLGLVGSAGLPFASRTQAAQTAAVLSERLSPGDVVVYCPDQLGPAVSRLLPAGTEQLVYPTAGPPARVDWVDYAARNRAADPDAFGARVAARASGAVWLVRADGYRTFADDCEALDVALSRARGGRTQVLEEDDAADESSRLVRFP